MPSKSITDANGQWKILLVDDDDGVREVNRIALQAAGYRVTTAGGGKQAVELLRQAWFDVIITVLHMPVVDGLTVLTTAKKIDAQAKVIIMTGNHNFEYAFDALQRGVDGYLLKPFPIKALVTCVADCIVGRTGNLSKVLQKTA